MSEDQMLALYLEAFGGGVGMIVEAQPLADGRVADIYHLSYGKARLGVRQADDERTYDQEF